MRCLTANGHLASAHSGYQRLFEDEKLLTLEADGYPKTSAMPGDLQTDGELKNHLIVFTYLSDSNQS